MSILTLFIILTLHIGCRFSFCLDSTYKNVRNRLCFTIKNRSLSNSFHPYYPDSHKYGNSDIHTEYFNDFKHDRDLNFSDSKTKLFSQQKFILVHSGSAYDSPTHYSNLLFSETKSYVPEEDKENVDKKSKPDEEEIDEELDEIPDNEQFLDKFATEFDPAKNSLRLSWLHPMPGSISQMAAFQCVTDLMPKSLIHQCFDVADDSNLDEILYTKLGPYYSTLSYDLFFKYQKAFYFGMDGGQVVKNDLKPLKIDKPFDHPEMESSKSNPSVPLGWRTFAVLGLYNSPNPKDDPSVYWPSPPLSDGDPPPRIASGLFKYGNLFNWIASRDAVAPDGSLLYSTDHVEPGELFTGEKGDMSVIPSEPPDEYKTINEKVYRHMISEDGMWYRKNHQNLVASLSLLQALWARLSTTMIKSTSKVIKMYRLKTRKLYKKEIFSVKNKLDMTEYHKSLKKGPVEFNLGVLYFMAAPTLHHALQLACSDPVARSNLYKNLLIFEVEDGLKDAMITSRDTDKDNPREYLILGKYSKDQPIEMLNDRMIRFLIRSNCVKSYYELKSPRKDNLADINLPLQQLLPFKQYLNLMLKNDSVRNACLNVNSSSPIANLSIINKFEFDEAIEWAHRNPYTRAGCYDSLFVTMAHEVGFYPQNCRFVLPVPVTKKLIPHGQEYVTIDRDPLKILCERMKQTSGHMLTIPNNVNKYVPKADAKLDKVKANVKNDPDRLLIAIKKTVSSKYSGENISKLFSSHVNKSIEHKLFEKGKYSVLIPSDGFVLRTDKLCKVQSLPTGSVFTLESLIKTLNENAPLELDRPFYAKFLKDYIYISLPEGHFFEPNYQYDDKYFHRDEEGLFDSDVSSQEMLLLDKYKVKPQTGFWIKKKDFYIFKNRDHFVVAPNREKTDKELDPKLLKGILIQDEVYMDKIRKGGGKERLDVARSYTKHNEKIITHMGPEEQMKTAFSVWPLNRPFTRYSAADEIPYSRFYLKNVPYPEGDPRHLMSHYPYELYQIHLDFMDKLDRGLVSIEDDPLKIMVEGHFEEDLTGMASISTWEEPDKSIFSDEEDNNNANQ